MDDWQVLSVYDGDPTPGTPASIQATVATLLRRAAEVDGHSVRLRAIAGSSGAMALRGDFAATVDRDLGRLPGAAKVLADAYLAGAKALAAFADELTRLQAQSRSALRLGMASDRQYRSMLQQFCGLTGMRTYGPGVWRGLNESYAAPLREPVRTQAIGIARNARLCEAERERARASALQAKQLYEVAATRCAAAIRAAAPRSTWPAAGAPGGTGSQTRGFPGPAGKKPLLPPHHRHDLERIQPGSGSKATNTVVLPNTNVAGDIDDINNGRATWDGARQRYVVNGRTYIPKDGRVVPESGEGFEALDHQEYEVLKTYIKFLGDVDAGNAELARNRYITPAHKRRALEVFSHHTLYRGASVGLPDPVRE